MTNLLKLAQDKATLNELREYFSLYLKDRLVTKALLKQDITGYAEANEIIKFALTDLEKQVAKKPSKSLNQSE